MRANPGCALPPAREAPLPPLLLPLLLLQGKASQKNLVCCCVMCHAHLNKYHTTTITATATASRNTASSVIATLAPRRSLNFATFCPVFFLHSAARFWRHANGLLEVATACGGWCFLTLFFCRDLNSSGKWARKRSNSEKENNWLCSD